MAKSEASVCNVHRRSGLKWQRMGEERKAHLSMVNTLAVEGERMNGIA